MRVFAYLDPGSASVALQALLGGAAAALVAVKMFGKRVFRTLMFWKHDDEEGPKASSAEPAAQRKTEKEPV